MLKESNEATLAFMDTVFKIEEAKKKKISIYDYVGILTKKETRVMRLAFEGNLKFT